MTKADSWHERCPLCSSQSLSKLGAYAHAHLIRCDGCGVTFAGRRPADADLEAHYSDYGHAWQDSPITRVRYRELLETFEPWRMTNRLLDVGCGAGFFLDEARARGWRVCGTEYSERALALARGRGHVVTQAPVAVDGFEPNSFDVVTAFEVFEHVKDPLSEAAALARVLRPGGLLYCTTPNFNSVSRRVLGPRWSVIEYAEHLWYFTPRTLRRWLERSGFVTQSIESSGVSLSRLQSTGRRTETGAASWTGTDERVRSTIEHSRLLRIGKAGANHLLSAVAAGDTLKGRFRRDNL